MKKITSTMEDYLEAIYYFKKKQHFARVSEIAKKLDVKSPTVNNAVKSLVKLGLVTHEKYGYIGLTKEGEAIGAKIQKRHDILYRFLTEFLSLDAKKAKNEACLIEHSISQDTYNRLTKFFSFIEEGFNGEKPLFLKNFSDYLKTGKVKQCNLTKK